MFEITDRPIKHDVLRLSLQNPRAGALVTFEGWVRNHHEGKDVEKLEYEAYSALCESEALKIEQECLDKFDILEITCTHRVGECTIGEIAVWIGVSAEHRGPAFDACEYYIDHLKARLPIWKKEYFVGEEPRWVRCDYCDHVAAHLHEKHEHHHH